MINAIEAGKIFGHVGRRDGPLDFLGNAALVLDDVAHRHEYATLYLAGGFEALTEQIDGIIELPLGHSMYCLVMALLSYSGLWQVAADRSRDPSLRIAQEFCGSYGVIFQTRLTLR